MVVKFILTVDGNIYFGSTHYMRGYHADVATEYGIHFGKVKGGGLADLESEQIFGTSYRFGPYDVEEVKRALPGWQVDCPSDY